MSATSQKQENHDDYPAESDDDFQYEEVSLDDWSLTEGEEDLETTVKAIQSRTEAAAASRPTATHQPEAVDDFLRNFLLQMSMAETLECFQTEWIEVVQKGLVDAERVGVVPEVYTENKHLESELKNAQREREEYRRAASAAAHTLGRVQKARDFHRMQHKRVVQEKNRLIEEMRKLKVQCNSYKPAVKRMNEKYQAVLKQIMLVTLEREKQKALGQESLQSAQGNIPSCGCAGEGGEMNRAKESRVKGTSPPISVNYPKSETGCSQ